MDTAEDATKKRAFEGFHRVMSDSEIYKSKDFDRAEVMVAMKNFVGLAFKAYDEPEVDGLTEHMSKGKRIQHLNHEIAGSAFEGVLKICLKEARNVIDSDIALRAKNRRSDPYVVFSSGATSVKSKFIKKTRNPVWNSTHYLLLRKHQIRSDHSEKLSVDLFDDDKHQGSYLWRSTLSRFAKNDLLGSAEIDLKQLREPGVHAFELQMKDAKGVETEQMVSFTTEFISFDTACEEMDVSSEGSDWLVSTEAVAESTGTSDSGSIEIACPSFEPFAFVEVPATNTQAWLYVNRSAKMVVISFRGTQPNRIKDVLTDVNILPVKLGDTFHDVCILKARSALRNPNIRVHRGFLKAYRSIREAVLQLAYDVTQWDEEWNICTTGHSLGGALATLCAFEFSNRRNDKKCGPVVGMMNFGAPRVGNEAFTSACNKTIAGSFRIVSKDDIIHLVPHHFAHVGKECLCLPDGEVEISDVTTRNANVEATIFTYAKEILGSDSTKAAVKLLMKRGQEAFQAATNHVREHYSTLIDEAIKKFTQLACSEERGDEKASEIADNSTDEAEMSSTNTEEST